MGDDCRRSSGGGVDGFLRRCGDGLRRLNGRGDGDRCRRLSWDFSRLLSGLRRFGVGDFFRSTERFFGVGLRRRLFLLSCLRGDSSRLREESSRLFGETTRFWGERRRGDWRLSLSILLGVGDLRLKTFLGDGVRSLSFSVSLRGLSSSKRRLSFLCLSGLFSFGVSDRLRIGLSAFLGLLVLERRNGRLSLLGDLWRFSTRSFERLFREPLSTFPSLLLGLSSFLLDFDLFLSTELRKEKIFSKMFQSIGKNLTCRVNDLVSRVASSSTFSSAQVKRKE